VPDFLGYLLTLISRRNYRDHLLQGQLSTLGTSSHVPVIASYKVPDTSQQTSDLQLVIDVTPNSALGKLLLMLKGPCDVSSEAYWSQLLQSASYKVSDTSQQASDLQLVTAVAPNSLT